MVILNAVRLARRLVLPWLVFAALPGMATAQPVAEETAGCASPLPAYRFLRFSEDWQLLRNPACPGDTWDAMKSIALGENGESRLTLGGDARLSLINARYLSFGNEGGDNHDVFLQRYAISVVATLAGALGAFFNHRSHERRRAESAEGPASGAAPAGPQQP